MMAPASDYFLSCLVFYIIIHWLDMYVRHERSYVPYILLALLGVFAITIKLSAAPMLLLSIVPIYKLLHNRTKEKMGAFWISVLLAFVIVIPHKECYPVRMDTLSRNDPGLLRILLGDSKGTCSLRCS